MLRFVVLFRLESCRTGDSLAKSAKKFSAEKSNNNYFLYIFTNLSLFAPTCSLRKLVYSREDHLRLPLFAVECDKSVWSSHCVDEH